VHRHSHRILVTALLCCAAFLPLNAHAWGSEAHHVIAEVAETQLSAVVKSEVSRLLALEPGSTLTSISTWADEHRSAATAAQHYVNSRPERPLSVRVRAELRHGGLRCRRNRTPGSDAGVQRTR
jgi:hypothetical protein